MFLFHYFSCSVSLSLSTLRLSHSPHCLSLIPDLAPSPSSPSFPPSPPPPPSFPLPYPSLSSSRRASASRRPGPLARGPVGPHNPRLAQGVAQGVPPGPHHPLLDHALTCKVSTTRSLTTRSRRATWKMQLGCSLCALVVRDER